MPRTRNRKPRPAGGAYATSNLALWHANPDRPTWALSEPRVREALSVLINERVNVRSYVASLPGESVTENRLLGIYEGYDAALRVFAALAGAPPDTTVPFDHEPDYPRPSSFEQPSDV